MESLTTTNVTLAANEGLGIGAEEAYSYDDDVRPVFAAAVVMEAELQNVSGGSKLRLARVCPIILG